MNPDEIDHCLRVLEALAEDRAQLAALDETRRCRLLRAAGLISRPARDKQRHLAKAFRKRDRALVRERDAALMARTLNRITRRSSELVLAGSTARDRDIVDAEVEELHEPRHCYICKTKYHRLHHFYDSLC